MAKPSAAELRQKSPAAAANAAHFAEQEASGIRPAQYGQTRYAGPERRNAGRHSITPADGRVPDHTANTAHSNMRRRQGDGEMSGSAELREFGRKSSAQGSERAVRLKGFAEREGLTGERGSISPALMRDIGLGTAGAATGAALANDDSKVAGGALGAIGGLAAANPIRAAKRLQELRVLGMLSGAALPKSIAGNIGAVATSAWENTSLKPFKEALRLPTNARNAVHGWKNNANPAHIAGVGQFNWPARAMGALDNMTTKTLMRGGETLEGAQRLLLTSPNTMGDASLGRMMKSDVGRIAFPFQNTPMNAVAEGGKSLSGMIGRPVTGMKPHTKAQKALTATSIGAGATAGATTDDPRLLALAAAFFGPRGIPFAMGAGTTAGSRVMNQMGVGLPDGSWSDFINPEEAARPITDPAILRFIEWLQGQQR